MYILVFRLENYIDSVFPDLFGKGADFMQRLDTAVIGTGPAGLEAAINLKIRQKSFVLFGAGDLSRKLALAPKIDNYLGSPGISGIELARRFEEHLAYMEIEITQEQVTTVYDMGDYFALATPKQTYEARTVILATGVFAGRLLPGEEKFLGRGVGYCATCDAPLYRGKTVAILGWNDESVLEANFVAELASTVYLIPMKKIGIIPNSKVQIVAQKPLAVEGGMKVNKLVLDSGELSVDGVFILRETIAPSSLVPGLELEDGFIKIDAMMRTNLPGCFAAGDVTGKPHQYMRAAGQGQTAALSAVSYLAI